jgi:hypothetical protein
MSFSIYLSKVNNDDGNMFDRAVVEYAFKDIAVNQTGAYWNLRSPNGHIASATIFIGDRPKISGFSANRPPSYSGFPKFWNARVVEYFCVVAEGEELGTNILSQNFERFRSATSDENQILKRSTCRALCSLAPSGEAPNAHGNRHYCPPRLPRFHVGLATRD